MQSWSEATDDEDPLAMHHPVFLARYAAVKPALGSLRPAALDAYLLFQVLLITIALNIGHVLADEWRGARVSSGRETESHLWTGTH